MVIPGRTPHPGAVPLRGPATVDVSIVPGIVPEGVPPVRVMDLHPAAAGVSHGPVGRSPACMGGHAEEGPGVPPSARHTEGDRLRTVGARAPVGELDPGGYPVPQGPRGEGNGGLTELCGRRPGRAQEGGDGEGRGGQSNDSDHGILPERGAMIQLRTPRARTEFLQWSGFPRIFPCRWREDRPPCTMKMSPSGDGDVLPSRAGGARRERVAVRTAVATPPRASGPPPPGREGGRGSAGRPLERGAGRPRAAPGVSSPRTWAHLPGSVPTVHHGYPDPCGTAFTPTGLKSSQAFVFFEGSRPSGRHFPPTIPSGS